MADFTLGAAAPLFSTPADPTAPDRRRDEDLFAGYQSQLQPQDPAKQPPTAFTQGIINYADAQRSSAPAFVRSRDFMLLDPDVDGSMTERWAQRNGLGYGRDYVAGLNVFGRSMSKEQLEETDAGKELLALAAKRRRGERRGFWDALSDLSWGDLPFVGMVATVAGSAVDAFQVHNTLKKLQDGEAVTDEELVKTRLFLAKQEYDQLGSWGATVGDIVRQAPGFVTEFVFSGGVLAGARAALAKGLVKKAGAEVGEKATSLAVGRGVKRLTKELVEEGLEQSAKETVGSQLSGRAWKEAIRTNIANMTAHEQAKFTTDLAKSLQGVVQSNLRHLYGEKATAMYSDEVAARMARNLVDRQVKRTVARAGSSGAFRRFGQGLYDFAKDHISAGLLDHGGFGTLTASSLFGKYNKAGQALSDALGILAVEAPLKGALQFGMTAGVRRGIMAATGTDYVTEAQLNLEAKALQMGNRRLMDSAEAIALGMNYMEFASENTGMGFSNLFRSAGLATGLSEQVQRRFVKGAAGVLVEAPSVEEGGFLRGLVRKAVGSWEKTAQKTADMRTASVFNYLKRSGLPVDRASAARIAAGDVSHVTDQGLLRFIGGKVDKFVTRAVRDEAAQKTPDKLYRTYLRYWAAKKMADNHWGPDELMNAFQRMGYDGIVEEMMEERYNDFVQGLFGMDEKGHAMFSRDALVQALRNIVPGTDELPWDQLTAEAVGFAIPMGVRMGAMHVMRAVGGPTVLSETREIGRAVARSKDAMSGLEAPVEDYRDEQAAIRQRLVDEQAQAQTELNKATAAAQAQGLEGEDLKAAVAAAREKVDSVKRRIDAQDDAVKRVTEADGIEDLAAEAADRVLFAPITTTETEKGDLKGDKLRANPTSDQMAEAAGLRGTAVDRAWVLGKAAYDSMDRTWEDREKATPLGRRIARKLVGLAAALVTGEPALAMRNYVSWAAVDEGCDPLLVAMLRGKYQEDREEAKNRLQAQPGRTDTNFSEDELWAEMSDRYKKNASDIVSSYLAMHSVLTITQADIRAKVVDHLARKAGYVYRDGAWEKDDGSGNAVRVTSEDFARDNADRVKQYTSDVTRAAMRILAERRHVSLAGDLGWSSFTMPVFKDDPNDHEGRAARERLALVLASQLAGFRHMLKTVRLGENDTAEDAAEFYAHSVDADTVARVREAAVAPDGTVDYEKPDEKDILEIASALGRDVQTASDEELKALRRGVVDTVRQASAVDTERVRTYVAEVDDPVLVRKLGKPYMEITARQRADGQWVATVDLAEPGKDNAEGKVDIVVPTLEEMDRELSKEGYSRKPRSIVFTPVMNIVTSNPVKLMQELGLMDEYLRRTSAPIERDGVSAIDVRYIHPALRLDEKGRLVNEKEKDVQAVLRAEMTKAWMFERFGQDPSRYPVSEEAAAAAKDAAVEKVKESTEYKNLLWIAEEMDLRTRAARGEVLDSAVPQAGEEPTVEQRNKLVDKYKENWTVDGLTAVLEHMVTDAGNVSRRTLQTAAMRDAQLAHDALYGERGYMKVMNDMLAMMGAHVPMGGGLAGALLGGAADYSISLVQLTARRSSANYYVAVDYSKGQPDSSALLQTVLLSAYSRHSHLVARRGRYVSVIGDFMKYLYKRANDLIYGDNVTSQQREALVRFRDQVAARADHPTSGHFAELAAEFALFAAEKDKADGVTTSSPHSLACQALSSPALYGSSQFIRFFALVDVMLGGSGFAYDIAARKAKAELPGKTGVARVMDLFGTETQALSDMVSEVKPLGKTYTQFIEEVNRQARSLNPKAQPAEGESAAKAPESVSGLLDFFRNVFAKGDFSSFEGVQAVFDAASASEDAEVRKYFAEPKQRLEYLKDTIGRRLQERENRVAELNARVTELQKQKEGNEGELAKTKKDLEDAGKQIEDLQAQNAALTKERDLLLRGQSADKAGETRKTGDPVPSATRKPDSGQKKRRRNPVTGNWEDPDGLPLRIVVRSDIQSSPAVAQFDAEGRVAIAEYDPAVADLPDEACGYGALAMHRMISALRGSEDQVSEREFADYLNRLGSFRPAEVSRLYRVYVNRRQLDIVERAIKAASVDEEEDNEGDKGTNDYNFNEKLLSLYEGKELDAFLTLSGFIVPEEGRSLQGVLDNIRSIVADRLTSATEGTSLHRTLSRLDRLLNPRAVMDIHTKEYDELTAQIEALMAAARKEALERVPDRIRQLARDVEVFAGDAAERRAKLAPGEAPDIALLKLERDIARGRRQVEDAVRAAMKPSPELEKLRVQRAELFTNVQREAEWHRVLKELDEKGPDGRTGFDVMMGDLMPASGENVSVRAAFLLSFLSSLGPAARTRLLSLCANSAVCSKAQVDLESGELAPNVGQSPRLDSRTSSAVFAPLRRCHTRGEVADLARQLRDKLGVLDVATGIPRFDKLSSDLTKRVQEVHDAMGLVANAIEEVFGSENVLVRALRSEGLMTYLRTVNTFGGVTVDTSPFEALARCATVVKKSTSGNTSDLVATLKRLLDVIAQEYSAEVFGAKDVPLDPVELNDDLNRLTLAWFGYGVDDMGVGESAVIGHKQAGNSMAWARLLAYYSASRPATVAPSVYIPGRSVSTTSKVVVSAPGVVPVIAQWMDRPISDKTGFAYIAKNFMLGATGDRLRGMSDADFLEFVYPRCRQTMTWPDAQHTPILAKNLTRDYTPDFMHERCADLFARLFATEESGKKAATGAALRTDRIRGEEVTSLRPVRWYSQVFPGEHTSGVLLQLPGLAYRKVDGNTGKESYVTFVKAGETFDEVSTRINQMVGLSRLGDDAKRAALTTAQVPAVSLRGSKVDTATGQVVYGETRVHTLLTTDPELLFANQETMKGLIVGVGYGMEEQRRAASNPASRVLKLHYMNTSGVDLELFKGLTVTAEWDAAGRKAGGLYTRGTVVRALQDYLLAFRKGDSDVSTSVMTDRDGIKVALLNSKVMGVVVDGRRTKLLDYILARVSERADSLPDEISLEDLDKMLGDGRTAGEGENADDYRPGTFSWQMLDAGGNTVTVRRTVSELFRDQAGVSDVRLRRVKELGDKAFDFSYVDNGLMSYTVANVSHDAVVQTGKMPRNTMLDAATMATMQLRGNMAAPGTESERVANQLLDNYANWGMVVAALAADPALFDDFRHAGRSSRVKELIEGKGDDPNSPTVDGQVAYDAMKRVRETLNLPFDKVDCALVSAAAMYNDTGTGSVASMSADPFLRYAARGSRVFAGRSRDAYNGFTRSLGWAQINVRSDGFRYVWHLDRKKFAEAYGVAEDASVGEIRRRLAQEFTAVRALDRQYVASETAADWNEEAVGVKKKQAQDARKKLAECFVDHYGRRVSEMKVQYEQKRECSEDPDASDLYCHSVSFEDLFFANPRGTGRVFDMTAVHGGDAALALGKEAAARAGAAHMAEDGESAVVLAGTAFGMPRTPSYNGSMWLQVLRASVYASVEEDETGQVTGCGKDAVVMPDAQSLEILGCDHDGDKSACYMYRVNTAMGGVVTTLDLPSTMDAPAADILTGEFASSAVVRRRYLDWLVEKGVVRVPVARKTEEDDRSHNVYELSNGVADGVGNSFVQGMFDLSRNLVLDTEDVSSERDFYRTKLARRTRAQPVYGDEKDPTTLMGQLLKAAGDAGLYLKGKTLADARAAAHVATSAMMANRARAQAVSFVGMLHTALMSGRFESVLFRGHGESKLSAWFDFVYGLDGISNATFDDIKNQVCRRLGWTPGMFDTVVVDLMTSSDRVPTSDQEFFDILIEYVRDISAKGSRYYMLMTSEPSDGNAEVDAVQEAARKFAIGESARARSSVRVDAVLARFHMRETRGERGEGRVYRLDDAYASSAAADGVEDKLVRAIVKAAAGFHAGAAEGEASAAEKRFCTAVVKALTARSGTTSGLGYVYWLADALSAGGSSDAVEGFLRWSDGVRTVEQMREFAAAVNYSKADPADANKFGRRETMFDTYDRLMSEDGTPAGSVTINDARMRTMNLAVRTLYNLEVLPTEARVTLAANNRGVALSGLVMNMGTSFLGDAEGRMMTALAALPTVSPNDKEILTASYMTDSAFFASLIDAPKALSGQALVGSRDYTWAVFDAIAAAVRSSEAMPEDLRENLPPTMALRYGMEAMISVAYSLASTSVSARRYPGFAALTLPRDHRYTNDALYVTEQDPESGAEATRRVPRYVGVKNGYDTVMPRHGRPLFARKDSAGLDMIHRFLGEIYDGALDGGTKRVASFTAARNKATRYTLDLENLTEFYKEVAPEGSKENTAKEIRRDISLVKAILERLAAVCGVDKSEVSIQPSTIVRQLIAVYSTMTERFGSDNSLVELVPGLRARLSATQTHLMSGFLDNNAAPGFTFWDILAATAKAPVVRSAPAFSAAVPAASRMGPQAVGRVRNILLSAAMNPGATGNAAAEAAAEAVRDVFNGGPNDRTATAADLKAPEKRVMLDVLGPSGLFRSVHEYIEDMEGPASTMFTGSEPEAAATAATAPAPADTEVMDAKPRPETDATARRFVTVLKSLVGRWADVEWTEGTGVMKVRAREGLKGSAAKRFAGRTDMVITIRLGSDSKAGTAALDVNSPSVAASLCAAAPKLGLTPEQFMTSLTREERQMVLDALLRGTDSQREGSAFSLSLPSWSLSGRDLAVLAGEIHLGENATEDTLYHELFHTMIGMFRVMDVFTDEDVAEFRRRFGDAPKGTGWLFNEEKAAEAFRRYVERRANGEVEEHEGKDGKTYSIFRKLWIALKGFFNALKNGFSYTDPNSRSFLFDMMLTGRVVMSKEKEAKVHAESVLAPATLDRIADNEGFAYRLYEGVAGDESARVRSRYVESGGDAKAASRKAEAAAAARVDAALERRSADPFAGAFDEAASEKDEDGNWTLKAPVDPRGVKPWRDALVQELQRPGSFRVSAVRELLRGLIRARRLDVDEAVPYVIPEAGDAPTWRTVVQADAALSPETRAAIYAPADVFARAAARRLVGTMTDADLAIARGAASTLSFADQLAATERYKALLKRTNTARAEQLMGNALRADATVKLGIRRFRRMEGAVAGDAAADEEAYRLLMLAAPYVEQLAPNRQRGGIATPTGVVGTRMTRRATAESYAAYLMAAGWHDAGYYLQNVRDGLVRARDAADTATDPARVAGVAGHLLSNLARFDKLDSASMVSDTARWDEEINSFMREVMTGVRRGDLDVATMEEGDYYNTDESYVGKLRSLDRVEKETWPQRDSGVRWTEAADLRTRNHGIYGFVDGAPQPDDALVSEMLRDAVTTVLAVRATVRFATALGTVPGAEVDFPSKAMVPAPLDIEELAEQFRLSVGELAEGDRDIVEMHCQPSFVAANLEAHLAAALPARVGSLPLRQLMMSSSRELRGHVSAQVATTNFLANYLGLSRTEGNKLLRVVEREGKFDMSGGFWHAVEEGQRKKYIGFDVYHGVNGQTTSLSFTEDEYRVVDLFAKALAVVANGGRMFITGAEGLQFSHSRRLTGAARRLLQASPADLVEELLHQESSEGAEVGGRPQRQMLSVEYTLARLVQQLPEDVLTGPGMQNYFRRCTAAVERGVRLADQASQRRLDTAGETMSDAEYNDIVLAELEAAGVAVCHYGEEGLRENAAFAIPAADIEAMFRGSEAYKKLTSEEGGRKPEMLTSEWLVGEYMKEWHALRREVAKQPWLTEGDARFLNNFATPLPFYQGTGNFMYHANRVVRDRHVSAMVRLAKHEATFINMCSSELNMQKGPGDLSSAELRMVHDYYKTDEEGHDLLAAIVEGKYAPGTRKATATGFAVDPNGDYLQVVRLIYQKVQERYLLAAEGRTLDELDDEGSIKRMIQAYEQMADAGGTTLTGATGMTDERMYQLHGVLPMNMQIGHKVHVSMQGVVDALHKRTCLVNMMFTKTLEGNPVYYVNPSRYGVEAGGVPDEVWGQAAKWWAARHRDKGLVYDPKLSGVENARAMYSKISDKLREEGKLNGRSYEALSEDDLMGQRSVANVLCVKDDPEDSDTSRLNVMGGVGEAKGYMKHLFAVDRVPGTGGRWAWLDKALAYSKSLSVMGSAFFPIATKWESATAAVGVLATLGSNISPETIRRHPKMVNALQKLFGGTDWADENFIGFRDIVEMMDTNDPFLIDIIRWAEALGITMSNTIQNPMEPGKGHIARDIASFKERLRSWGWKSETASKWGAVLETLFMRSGEKAFTYALNATKLAVTCQIAMKLRRQAQLEGRAFDPIRDLAKYAAYIDTEIGGIDPLRYAWMHPMMQRIMNRTFFSWQWTRSAWEAGGGHFFEDLLFGGHSVNKETRGYLVGRWLRMYGVVMIGIPMMAQILIKALAKAFGIDDDDDKWFTWQNEDKAEWSAFNLTPLMKLVHQHELTARAVTGGLGALYGIAKTRSVWGGLVGAAAGAAGAPDYTGKDAANRTTMNRKYYMHFGKQGWEFYRWFDDPVSQAMAKLTMPNQRSLESLFGRNFAYLDRELPFADKSLAERWLDFSADGALVNLAKGWYPFVANGITTFGDAGIASYFGPVQMGASQTNIMDRYVKALKKWADNDRTAYAFGGANASRPLKKRLEAVHSELLSDITRDAKSNGIRDPEELIVRAVGQLVPRYYARLVDLLPMRPDDPVDNKEIAKVCRALRRLGATYEGAVQSVNKRLKMRGIDVTQMTREEREPIRRALKTGFEAPFDY